ncbi:uncharacterized protein LOC133185969 [Saccostrea echinata]|uniref:uncharacterized protein LOC133185969 n=1 Tax=Saccostrea echinata TaxID=191078 RepID=UPI002A7FE64E|nr:uncharacterized protein LOC133185969 [Saccostrea echinata]
MNYSQHLNVSNGTASFRDNMDLFEPPDLPEQLRYAAYVLNEYSIPVLFSVGVCLNIIIIISFLSTELSRVSPCLYFVALAFVDITYLLQMMVPWASSRVYNIYAVAGICQLTYYFHYLSTFMEWWLMVLMMIERSLVLLNRKKAKVLCSPFRTKCIIISMCVFSVVSHLYLTWTSAVIKIRNVDNCIIIPENLKNIFLLRKIDVFFSFIVPSLCLYVLLTTCIIKLCDNRRNGDRRPSPCHSSRRSNCSRRPSNLDPEDRRMIYLKKFYPKVFMRSERLTVTCCILSAIFLILCVPFDSLRTRLTFEVQPDYLDQKWLEFLSVFSAFNYTYKAFLYFIAIKEFRQTIWILLKKIISPCSNTKLSLKFQLM